MITNGRERCGLEPHPGNPPMVQVVCQLVRICPRRADQLEWRCSAAPDAHVRAFRHRDTRIKHGLRKSSEIRRGGNPLESGCVVPLPAMIPAHLDHMQASADSFLALEHPR